MISDIYKGNDTNFSKSRDADNFKRIDDIEFGL